MFCTELFKGGWYSSPSSQALIYACWGWAKAAAHSRIYTARAKVILHYIYQVWSEGKYKHHRASVPHIGIGTGRPLPTSQPASLPAIWIVHGNSPKAFISPFKDSISSNPEPICNEAVKPVLVSRLSSIYIQVGRRAGREREGCDGD